MTAFRVFLAVIFLSGTAYTVPVVASHGFTLFHVFFGDMAEMGWPGQFNFDFMGMLLMSGTWIAWRHRFTPAGLLLALGGYLLGAPFLSAYLLFASRGCETVSEVLARPAESR